MAYTDRQNRAFSRIAYYDLPKLQYYRDSGNSSPIPLDQLLSQKQKNELMEDFGVKAEEISTWKIAATHNKNDTNGFSACVIETGNHEAAVAFRGSELKANQILPDWVHADIALLTKIETEQQREVDKFLKNNQDMLREYTLTMTGHSLGGNLAEYATLVSHRYGLDTCIEECVSLDGPGFSTAFIAAHSEDIARMCGRMKHYRWSVVGTLMSDIPGARYEFVEVDPEKEDTLLERHGLKYANQFTDGNGDSFEIDEDGWQYIMVVTKEISQITDVILYSPVPCLILLVYNYSMTGVIATVTSISRRAATEAANGNLEFYLDTEQFHSLAQEYGKLAEKLRDIAKEMQEERSPSLTKVPIAGNVFKRIATDIIQAIRTSIDDIKQFVAWCKRWAPGLNACADVLDCTTSYLEDTATDFDTIEKLAQENIREWLSRTGVTHQEVLEHIGDFLKNGPTMI